MKAIHYVPPGTATSTCGWPQYSLQYRKKDLLSTDDVTKATCPRCIEGAADQVEAVLQEPTGPWGWR